MDNPERFKQTSLQNITIPPFKAQDAWYLATSMRQVQYQFCHLLRIFLSELGRTKYIDLASTSQLVATWSQFLTDITRTQTINVGTVLANVAQTMRAGATIPVLASFMLLHLESHTPPLETRTIGIPAPIDTYNFQLPDGRDLSWFISTLIQTIAVKALNVIGTEDGKLNPLNAQHDILAVEIEIDGPQNIPNTHVMLPATSDDTQILANKELLIQPSSRANLVNITVPRKGKRQWDVAQNQNTPLHRTIEDHHLLVLRLGKVFRRFIFLPMALPPLIPQLTPTPTPACLAGLFPAVLAGTSHATPDPPTEGTNQERFDKNKLFLTLPCFRMVHMSKTCWTRWVGSFLPP